MITQFIQKTLSLVLVISFIMTPFTMYASNTIEYQPQTKQELLAYLMGVLAQLQAQLAEQKAEEKKTETTYRTRNAPNPFYVNVVTLAPTTVERSIATVKGEFDKGGSEYLDAWLEYGVGSKLSRKENASQVIKNGRQAVEVKLKDLRSDTTYSYRFVAEDNKGYRHYGQTRTFTTVASAQVQSFNGRPTAETEGTFNVRANSAEVSGFISMNDYITGLAFFVYGSSKNDVEDADEYNTFKDIPVSGVVVNKRSVNAKFTGRNTIKSGISGLKPASRYYYSTCIEYYEDENILKPKLDCGTVESFTTLN